MQKRCVRCNRKPLTALLHEPMREVTRPELTLDLHARGKLSATQSSAGYRLMWHLFKRILMAGLVGLGVVSIIAAVWWHSIDLASQPLADPLTRPADLALLRDAVPEQRGRILAIVTSTERAGISRQIRAGLELTELSRAYYTFLANGYAVDIASPQGGSPPVRIDDELVEADHAFLNDPDAQRLLQHTLPLARVDPGAYAAVYFVGGKGVMFDLPRHPDIQRIVAAIDAAGGVIGAVCHGPAALIGVIGADGRPFLQGRRVAGFSNAEELFLIEDAHSVFPFLLQDALVGAGAQYSEGALYLDHTIIDGRLVTGQNPWSTWSVAEGMIRALGHAPVARERSSEELAVEVLQAFHQHGSSAAHTLRQQHPGADKRLLLLHALVALMQGRIGDGYRLQALAHG